MLIDLTPAVVSDAQISALANQLRLPTAYVETADGAERLRQHAGAANALIERRIGHVLIERSVEYRCRSWPEPTRVVLPLGPAGAVQSLGVAAPDGQEITVDPTQFHIDEDDAGPVLQGFAGMTLPTIADGQVAFVRYAVGYGEDWAAVPADLRLAAAMIAAALHDHGAEDPLSVSMPFGAITLLEPYRRMRL